MELQVANNLEDLAEGIGKLKGLSLGIKQRDYMDALISAAFEKTNQVFNDAAAVAAESMNFTHMFEYGVELGASAKTAPTDRLWVTTLLGGGGRKTINFQFLKADVPRTEVTEEEVAGISEDIIKKLKVNNGVEYPWPNKAEDTEENHAIFLRPREGTRALLIPLVQGVNDADETDQERGFALRTRYTNLPGEHTGGAGQFSEFFWEFWSGTGGRTMESEMLLQFNEDIKGFNKQLAVMPSPPKPASMVNVNATAEKNTGKTMKQWTLWAMQDKKKVVVA